MSVEPDPPRQDPLEHHLSSRRRWRRIDRASLVEVRGPRSAFMGQVLDLSRGGVQVAIVDPSFYASAGSEDGFALVTLHFPSGVTVHFVEEGIARRAQIVRITPHGDRWLALGCQFDTTLLGQDAVRLGVSGDATDRGDVAHVVENARDD